MFFAKKEGDEKLVKIEEGKEDEEYKEKIKD